MFKSKLWGLGWLCASLLGMAGSALAQGQVRTEATPQHILEKIAAEKTIYLGYREGAVPFTYADGKGGVQGYHWDLCLRIVDRIEQQLGVGKLQVVSMPTTPTSRVLMLSGGVMDLDCSPVTNTLTAQRQVDFGLTTFVSSLQVLVRKESGFKALAELSGRKVTSLVGGVGERFLRTNNALQSGMVINVPSHNRNEAMKFLKTGRVDALVLDDVNIAVLLAAAENPEDYQILGEALAFEPLAMVMAKSDSGLRPLVNETLAELMKNGEVEQLYTRWFMSPIPPDQHNLQLPLSEILRRLLATPNSEGI